MPADAEHPVVRPSTEGVAGQVTGQVTEQVERLLAALSGEMKRDELQSALGLAGRGNFTVQYLKPALDAGFIEMTIPEKPNSRLQRYRLTEAGRARLTAKRGDAR